MLIFAVRTSWDCQYFSLWRLVLRDELPSWSLRAPVQGRFQLLLGMLQVWEGKEQVFLLDLSDREPSPDLDHTAVFTDIAVICRAAQQKAAVT